MDKFLPMLLSAVLGGAVGGGLVHVLGPGADADTRATAAIGDLALTDAQIETLYGQMEAHRRKVAEGDNATLSAPKGNEMLTAPPALTDAQMDALIARHQAKLEASTKKMIEDQVKEAVASASDGERPRRSRRPRRQRKSLADAAAELQLSSAEEQALRDHYENITNKALGMLVVEGETIEDVRRELEAAKDDPTKRMNLIPKYMGRVIPAKIGEFIALEGERRKGVVDAVGKEKAREIESKYTIEESDPFNMRGGGFSMRADFEEPTGR